MKILIFFISLVYNLEAAASLKLLRVLVPPVAIRGQDVVLQCQYELGEDTLYSVKWYKDNEEFFKFVPKANPPLHSYRLEGVKVDQQQSNNETVTLRAVTLKSSGVYKCEVSAEAPSFSSAQGEGTINVVYLPKDGPHISGDRTQYEIGDDISLNCTSGRSHPASVLQWFINEKQVTHPAFLIPHAPFINQNGLVTVSLGLRLRVGAQHFVGGSMRVRCVASVTPVAPVLWTGNQESVVPVGTAVPDNLMLDNREALLLVRSRASALQRFRIYEVFYGLFIYCLLKVNV